MRARILRRDWARFGTFLAATSLSLVLTAILTAECAAATPAADARDPGGSSDLLAEQLATGEFAPAVAAASATPRGPERDYALEQIAKAQARGGALRAAYATLGGIGDDRLRGKAAGDMGRQPLGGAGGGAQPDFDALIELIINTVQPDSWDEAGGAGAIQEFEGGVFVDAQGVLKRRPPLETVGLTSAIARSAPATARPARASLAATDARRSSRMRKVSLPRLERELQVLQAQGRPIPADMLWLAGLQRVEYVLIYQDTQDVVLAGPAGDWRLDEVGRPVGLEGGRPLLRLDDLTVLLRQAREAHGAGFGCSIDPTADGLAKAQQFLNDSARKPLKPGQRAAWLEKLRATLGSQTTRVFGLDPHTRTAQVLLEADYHMKLVGIGLEEGTLDVPSYLEMLPADKTPGTLDVLRWWFVMDYAGVRTGPARDVFELRGPAVKLQCENELLGEGGKRQHTGRGNTLNQEFASNFTQHFDALAQKYPVYGELRNIFDMALVAALIESEGLADQAGWSMSGLLDPSVVGVPLGNAPQTVDTVLNHRIIKKAHIVAAVSGGVRAVPKSFVDSQRIQVERQGDLRSARDRSAPAGPPTGHWWWD